MYLRLSTRANLFKRLPIQCSECAMEASACEFCRTLYCFPCHTGECPTCHANPMCGIGPTVDGHPTKILRLPEPDEEPTSLDFLWAYDPQHFAEAVEALSQKKTG